MTTSAEQILSDYADQIVLSGKSPAYAKKSVAIISRFWPTGIEFLVNNGAATASLRQATINDYLNRLRIFRNWLRERPQYEAPAFEIPRQSPRSAKAALRDERPPLLTDEQVMRLTAYHTLSGERYKRSLVYALIARTGLRPVEVSRLKVEHFSHDSVVGRTVERYRINLPAAFQKNGRPAVLEVEGELGRRIVGVLLSQGALLREPSKLWRGFRRDCVTVGIEPRGRRPYDLRSYFITKLLVSGVDIESVRMLARHARPETTLRHYARQNHESALEAARECFRGGGPRENSRWIPPHILRRMRNERAVPDNAVVMSRFFDALYAANALPDPNQLTNAQNHS